MGVYYDPMIAKVIAWGEDRGTALRRLRAALADYQIVGLTTNLRFLRDLIALARFRTGAGSSRPTRYRD